MDIWTAWSTPRGASVELAYRDGTNDWNTLNAVLTGDEYGLRELRLEGTALDVGAYTGPVTVALLADNPALTVVAIEPVPDNLRLLRANLERNGLSDRAVVIDGAACGTGDVSATVWYGYSGSESLEHHRFVGNSTLAYETPGPFPHETREAPCTNLVELVREYRTFSFAKIDCEGCEYAFLDCGCARHISRIVGEYHPVKGQGRPDILRLLDLTHEVSFSGPEAGPGGFVAVLR